MKASTHKKKKLLKPIEQWWKYGGCVPSKYSNLEVSIQTMGI